MRIQGIAIFVAVFVALAKSETQCQREVRLANADGLVGAPSPNCKDDGTYTPQQCYGSTGECWCAHPDGTEIENTRTGPGEETDDCSERDCQHDAMAAIVEGGVDAFTHSCMEDGTYTPQQCHKLRGECWCAYPDGTEIENTRTGPDEETVDCGGQVFNQFCDPPCDLDRGRCRYVATMRKFTCTCLKCWTGTLCNVSLTNPDLGCPSPQALTHPCNPNPCQNLGYCTSFPGENPAFGCTCLNQNQGVTCSDPLDPPRNACLIPGQCPDGKVCSAPPDMIGFKCLPLDR